VVPLVGAVSALIMSVVYAYITVYSPIGGYISALFVVGYGFAVGICTAIAANVSKCRSTKLAGVLGFLVGLFAVYSAWVLFTFVFLRRAGADAGDALTWSFLPRLFVSPRPLWAFIKLVNQEGWFSIAGGTPKGIVLWIFWAIEAAIIVGMTTILTYSVIDDEVFCESCRKWAKQDDPLRLALPDDEDIVPRLISGDVAALNELSPADLGEYPHLIAELKHCDKCNQLATYRLQYVDLEDTDGNEPKATTKNLTNTLILSAEARQRVQELRGNAAEKQAAAPAPTTDPS
jgi:hypothetical protein